MSLKPLVPASETRQSSFKTTRDRLEKAIRLGRQNLLQHRHPDGYWWYTLEANDTINAEYILLMRYLGIYDPVSESALCHWLVGNQGPDGSWGLYHGGPGDLSTTVEVYIALKMAGHDINHPALTRARGFILKHGGITKVRVFTRIHLALFGLVSWDICPQMPVSLIQFPRQSPVNIYEFSSWARASIVPLLVIFDQKKSRPIAGFDVNELYPGGNAKSARWGLNVNGGIISIENFFIQIDKALQVAAKLKVKPLRRTSLKKCEDYIREHLSGTEDIYPAMFYGILAIHSLGYPLEDECIQKALLGLKSFQVVMSHNVSGRASSKPPKLPQIPFQDSSTIRYNTVNKDPETNTFYSLYQQCCISPVWDTAWAAVALCEAGLSPSDERLLGSARWLLSKQITDVYGDWAVKNKGTRPGGWSFEFHNKHYPDVDDTIEILTLLYQVDLPYHQLHRPFQLGLDWLTSMQSSSGGFAAFDKDNDLELLNRIPFADHGACLDPPTVDISGRMLEFLITVLKYDAKSKIVQNVADFIVKRQEKDGSFWGRWGVNYIYGTWCALSGLAPLGRESDQVAVRRGIRWLKSIQRPDGGFGESNESYRAGKYLPLSQSTASQTAWALLTYVACGLADSHEAAQAADFLLRSQLHSGGWEEKYHTGTGFPGHFYIRYHGYRHYFPLLALAKYRKALMK